MKMSCAAVFVLEHDQAPGILSQLENLVAAAGGLMVYQKQTPRAKLYIQELPFGNGGQGAGQGNGGA